MTPALATIIDTVAQQFQDLPDIEQATRAIVRVILAVLLGAAMGYERERQGKAAGLRTHMLVSLGAALFVLLPIQAGVSSNDLSRVIQGVVAGIGFLGAGSIIKSARGGEKGVTGLTTAASIWVAAGVGIAAGMGHGATAVLGTLAALFILSIVQRIEASVDPTKAPGADEG